MAGCTLHNSLTNIQWLGKISSDKLGSCSIKQEMEGKENCHLEQSQGKFEELLEHQHSGRTVSEQPPYSYTAMIQFTINSAERKHMTLKDIYIWIEDPFSCFKHMTEPGWKNSICHTFLSMFVQETSARSPFGLFNSVPIATWPWTSCLSCWTHGLHSHPSTWNCSRNDPILSSAGM